MAALVTGASGGIGEAIAVALAREGSRVGVVGRRSRELARVHRRLDGGPHASYVVDLTSDAGARALARSFVRDFGSLDVLVHSNGIYSSGALAEATLRDVDRMWAANVRGPLVLTKLCLPALVTSSGQIVFVNSSAGLDARAGAGVFSATQHALRALANALRAEVNEDGVRVLNVYPGRTATERQRRIFAAEGRSYEPGSLLQPDDIADLVVSSLALPRTAEVTDVQVRPLRKP
jgi:NADP-dependent 3-hydroxy acid dehydrogenase YdfG